MTNKLPYVALGLFLGFIVGTEVRPRKPLTPDYATPPETIEVFHGGADPIVAESLRVVSMHDGRVESAVSEPRNRPRWTVRILWEDGRVREYQTESITTP